MPEIIRPDAFIFLDDRDERRRYPRRPVYKVAVSGPVSGKLIDMSEAGFAVETRNRPTLHRKGIFRLDMGAHRPDFFGEVRWVRLTSVDPLPNGESVPVYRAGVALVQRSDHND